MTQILAPGYLPAGSTACSPQGRRWNNPALSFPHPRSAADPLAPTWGGEDPESWLFTGPEALPRHSTGDV